MKHFMYVLPVVATLAFADLVRGQNCVEPSPDIVAWWTFDETSGTVSNDIANCNDGVHVNGPDPFSKGKVDGALWFDGAGEDHYVEVPDSELWAFGTSDFTIEFWVMFDGPAEGNHWHPGDVFISNDEQAGTYNKWFFARSNECPDGQTGECLEFVTAKTGEPESYFSPFAQYSTQPGVWYHLAVTRTVTNYRIYVDGVLAGEAEHYEVMPDPVAPLTIGQSGETFHGYMDGALDEMTVYHRALTEAELLAIFEAGAAGKCKDLPCPWDLDCSGDVGGVGVNDFLDLLANWGQVGVPADFDGGGVGVTDFLILLALWGPCPE